MPSNDHDLLVLVTNLFGTDRLSFDAFERMKSFLINPLFRPIAEDATQWVTVGNTMFHEEQYSLALKCYANAIEINPVNLDAWNNISVTFERIGRLEEAGRCRQKIAEINNVRSVKKVK
ncbi:MAG: tetratricopeptide repeat protein [Methanoregulaceae archaeon]|jgi:tetratricopeptide (TPR) repeat protein|nr:tetratricopeptide repeat protein [Methanoregulaceae archaeon]